MIYFYLCSQIVGKTVKALDNNSDVDMLKLTLTNVKPAAVMYNINIMHSKDGDLGFVSDLHYMSK